MELLDVEMPAAQVAALWQKFFVFTAVRNPYTRAVSQYKFLARKLLPKPGCGDLVSGLGAGRGDGRWVAGGLQPAAAGWLRLCSMSLHLQRWCPAVPASRVCPPHNACAPPLPQVSWDAFCAFPPSMGLACAHRPECCAMGEGFAYLHLNSQARCMTTAGGSLAVDHVFRSETLDDDMAALFAQINRRRPTGKLSGFSAALVLTFRH